MFYFELKMKNWKNECRIRFLQKNKFVSVKRKLVKKNDDVLFRIKGVDEKTYHVENDKKKKKFFYKKNVCSNKRWSG